MAITRNMNAHLNMVHSAIWRVQSKGGVVLPAFQGQRLRVSDAVPFTKALRRRGPSITPGAAQSFDDQRDVR